MTSAELERRPQTDLQAQWGYAKALATAGTLPRAYRDKPGDVLLAMAYGEALGLHVTNVFTSVHIIDGRPSMSAELMQALIRRAGHRIRTKGDAQQATCVIVRKDDPDYAYSVTFTLDDARTAKLLPAKPDSGWAKYPGAMLLARAVSACARQACADVLAGVSYTAEELGAPMVDALPIGHPTTSRPPEATTGRPERPQEAPEAPIQVDTTQADMHAEEWRQAWLMDLSQAVELMDLEGITLLGTKALAGGGADAQELASMARQAWHDTQQQLAQQ
jgi:hypothetical protein